MLSKIFFEGFKSVNSVAFNVENQPVRTKTFKNFRSKYLNLILLSISEVFIQRMPIKDILKKGGVKYIVKFRHFFYMTYFFIKQFVKTESLNCHNAKKIPRKLSSRLTSKLPPMQ